MADLARAIACEVIGTAILVFVGCGSCLTWDDKNPPTIGEIALTFGFTVACVVHVVGKTSGGHLNPAVSISMVVARKMDPSVGLLYAVAQSLGAVLGACLLSFSVPNSVGGNLGMTLPGEGVGSMQALFIEFFITMFLTLVIFGVTDATKNLSAGIEPIVIGMAVTACHLAAIRMTGSSMNPARTFGSAFMSRTWSYHWIYWLGPCSGGAVGALIYEFVIA